VRFRAAALAAAWLTGCGYVGDPLPPALNIPAGIRELRAVQIGDRLVVEFVLPEATVENLPLQEPVTGEVRVGESVEKLAGGRAELPALRWAGQTVEISARAVSGSRQSQWSDPVQVAVIAPLQSPAELRAESHPKGVRLMWGGESRPGIGWRVFRGRNEVAQSAAPEYLDASAEFGKTYEYSVESVLGAALSERAGPVKITPEDKFAPDVPTGVVALPGVSSIELTWEPVTAPDLRGYRIYRFNELAGEVEVPAWSDKKVESSRAYAYSISAVDTRGNESNRSTPVELTAP
jgi:hypothetical protein